MTKEQIESIESVTLGIAGGVAIVYPPAKIVLLAIEQMIKWAEANDITPYELSVEQAAAIAAGMAAAKASAVTSFKESHKYKLPSDVK